MSLMCILIIYLFSLSLSLSVSLKHADDSNRVRQTIGSKERHEWDI